MVWPLLISLTSSSISHCFTPSIPAIVAFFPFFQHRKVIATSGPLHLFLLPEGKYSFPRVSYGPGFHFTEASPQVSLRRFCLSTYLNQHTSPFLLYFLSQHISLPTVTLCTSLFTLHFYPPHWNVSIMVTFLFIAESPAPRTVPIMQQVCNKHLLNK